MNDSKLTLYDVEWQALRVSLLGNWASLSGTYSNLHTLSQYVHASASKSRYWRVLNLLNAVRMGYSGQGLKGSKQDLEVRGFRDAIQITYNEIKDIHSFEVASAQEIQKEWAQLSSDVQKQIKDNLSMRLKLHSKSKHRDELRWFLSLIGESNA